jgi:hypothetical protein
MAKIHYSIAGLRPANEHHSRAPAMVVARLAAWVASTAMPWVAMLWVGLVWR